MMNHLAHYDFRMGNEKLPMCRFASMVAMLTTKRHADGLARLIVKADLDRMKGPLQMLKNCCWQAGNNAKEVVLLSL